MDLQDILAKATGIVGGMSNSFGEGDPASKIGSTSFASNKSLAEALSTSKQEKEDNEPKIKITDSKGYKTGSYSKKHIEGIIKASKAVGIDPHQALALALQESGIGTAKLKMRMGSMPAPFAMVHDFEPAQEKELEQRTKDSGIDSQYLKLAITLRDKLKYAKQLGFKDEASQLQAYNGYGTIHKSNFPGSSKAYGVEIGEGINMKENPLYGKRLLELKNDISKNEEIKKLLQDENPLGNAPTPKPSPNPLSQIF